MNDVEVRRIADAFALGRPNGGAVAVARGEMGRIWRIDTNHGPVAVKELFWPVDEDGAQMDVAYQHAALAAGLPLPRPILSTSGSVLVRLDRPDSDLVVRAYEWAELRRPPRRVTIPVAAALLARLHRLGRPADGPMDDWYAAPLGAERWAALRAEVRTARPPWQGRFERIIDEIEAADAIVEAARLERLPLARLRRCHLDFNPENVLADVAGQAVIVDWENSGSSTYELELGMAILDFTDHPRSARAFMAAYVAAGGQARIAGPGSFAMAIAVSSHIAEVYARAAMNATTGYDRRHYAARMAELARRPYTIEVVERILDALPG